MKTYKMDKNNYKLIDGNTYSNYKQILKYECIHNGNQYLTNNEPFYVYVFQKTMKRKISKSNNNKERIYKTTCAYETKNNGKV